ncbi:MAG: OB-fold nucleic acid binding domain-containing protein, partial [Thiotrichaceae bacterium]
MSEVAKLCLQQSVRTLPGVGESIAEKLERLGLHRIVDLLFHLPLRYQDRTRIYPIVSLMAGQEILVEGEIEATEVVQRGRTMLLCQINDGTGILTLRFFHFTTAQKYSLAKGATIRCFGEVRQAGMRLEMAHPEYRLLNGTQLPPIEDTLTPTYPSTGGLQQRTLRRLIELALEYAPQLPELLPESVLKRQRFPSQAECLHLLHNPPPGMQIENLKPLRLVFEELLA